MLGDLFFLMGAGVLIALLFGAAGWGRPVYIVAEFLSRWIARGLIVVFVGIGVWIAIHWNTPT